MFDQYALDFDSLQTSLLISGGANSDWYVLGYLYSSARSGDQAVILTVDQVPDDPVAKSLLIQGVADEFVVWCKRDDGQPSN